MAQQGSEASVASSSCTPNWWEIHMNQITAWNAMNRWQPQSNSSCEDQDMSNLSTTSFTNASNQSGLSMDSSSADPSGEPTENDRLWSQVLFSVGNGGGDLRNGDEKEEDFLELLSSKNLNGTEMFDPACDYLKKLDSSWEFTKHTPAVNSSERQLNGYYSGSMIEPERLTNLSDLVSNWSVAPPTATCNVPISAAMPHFSTSNISHIKPEIANSASYTSNGSLGYQVGLSNSMLGLNNNCCSGIQSDIPLASNARSLSDLISFGNCLSKPCVKGSELPSDSKKQGDDSSSFTMRSGRCSGTSNDGKKKRSDDSSNALLKKCKRESSSASSVKIQPPKVKLGNKIADLQQIVSPFGKTDTASVLLETINLIRFLQEQVQLLSNPYLKSNANKDYNSWGGLERKDKEDHMLDLRSKGLCVVPTSCIPHAYRENTGPDYWTPTYRGCLYR